MMKRSIHGKRLRVQGVNAHYLEAGNAGPTILIAASMLVMARSYRRLQRRLAEKARVIVVDLPGAGLSPAAGRIWTLDEHVAWLGDFMRLSGIEKPILLGHSNSGAVTIQFALRYPDTIAGLVLSDSVGLAPAKSVPLAYLRRSLDALYELPFSLTHWHHILWNVMVHPRNFFHQVRIASYVDLRKDVKRMTVPTLFAWGRKDASMPMEQSLQEVVGLPQRDFLISEASHDWILTRPGEFMNGLMAWQRLR